MQSSKEVTKNFLINFEKEVKETYEKGKIKAPIHLSGNNEIQLINIFKKIKKNDWVVSNWRNHYHALLHGFPRNKLMKMIMAGKSMSINSRKYKFFSSSIVGGGVPIALGLALALKKKKSKQKVWLFVGDMTYETGLFYESHKYARNFKLPLKIVVEDNGLSTNTPTSKAWNKKKKIYKDIIYYSYKRKYPHHGTGSWILF
jgi:TPP-dependent pyruvate/acetoin dehydrogenase alpha subunit